MSKFYLRSIHGSSKIQMAERFLIKQSSLFASENIVGRDLQVASGNIMIAAMVN